MALCIYNGIPNVPLIGAGHSGVYYRTVKPCPTMYLRSQARGFRIETLEKLSGVKDTVNKKSLLYHIVKRCCLGNEKKIHNLSSRSYLGASTSTQIWQTWFRSLGTWLLQQKLILKSLFLV